MKTRFVILAGTVLFALVLPALATTRYVDLNSPNPTSPYLSWDTAATNIQDAVDAADNADLILVTNGVYVSQGRSAGGAANCVIVDRAVTVQSVNGIAAVVIDGRGLMRGVYLTDGAVLDGFTVTNGKAINADGGGVLCSSTNASVVNCLLIGNTSDYGGGVANGTVSNSILKSNSASGSGGGARSCWITRSVLVLNNAGTYGGGASGGISTLNDCLVISNTASANGGGVFGSQLNNCVIVSNKTMRGIYGGALNSPMKGSVVVGNSGYGAGVDGSIGSLVPMTINSVVYYNVSGNYLGNGSGLHMTNCCTLPLPALGWENFTNPPAFVNLATGDFHLETNSPCINAGNNSMVTSALDLDGNPRIIGGTVDVGAYEFQSPASAISYAWLQKYGLPTDGSADFSDVDDDGANNWHEWRADTIPTNAVSVLRLVSATNGPTGAGVDWQSVATRRYWLERSTNLNTASFQIIATNITGVAGIRTFTDLSATNAGSYFYRVGVQ